MLWAAFGTRELWQIIGLSLTVSVSATAAAMLIGLPAGVALAIWRFPGRRLLIGAANALLGLPPVVVGLALYLLLSHSGPLGFLNLLFTPPAMVIAQAVLRSRHMGKFQEQRNARRRGRKRSTPDQPL